MIYTSYFANVKNLPASVIPVAICGKAPNWWEGLHYPILAPKWSFFSVWKETKDNDYYIEHFINEVLKPLDVQKVIKDLLTLVGNFKGLTYLPDIALICYEKPNEFCHRHLVRDWFRENGIACNEWINDSVQNQKPACDCIHYDGELALCRLHTSWSTAMPSITVCEGKCKDYEQEPERCRWCNNYRTDHNLNPDNDMHAGTVGITSPHYQIMYCTGNHDAPRIEYNRWDDKGATPMWHTMGIYYPKYCPECGRKIDEWPECHSSGNNVK